MPEAAPQEDVMNQMDQDQSKPETAISSLDRSHLSKSELSRVEKGETSIQDLVRERNQLAQTANSEMKQMLDLKDGDDALNMIELQKMKKQIQGYEKEVDACKSPEEMRALLEKIREIPNEMRQDRLDSTKQNEMEHEKLDVNDKALREKVKEFTQICKDNEHLLGGGDIKGYTNWFEQELAKDPTLANAQNIIDRLEGTKVYDKEGLAPRREVYNELTDLFKKYKLGSPQKSEFIKQKGLDERKDFLKQAKLAEDEVNKVNDQMWSPKAKEKAMQEILMAKNPNEQKQKTQDIKKMSKIESEGFTYMKNTFSINGVSVRKMSDASISEYLKGLKDEGNLQKRMDYITGNGKYSNGIKQAVENEGSLYDNEVNAESAKLFGITEGLAGIYKEHPDLFKQAVQSFEKLDFMKKVQELKKHKQLVETTESKEELDKKLTIKSAHTAIDEAARVGIMSKGDAKEDKEWFEDEKNYKNPETKLSGDLDTLKKHYKTLISDTPDAKAKNISAYKIKRNRFIIEAKTLHLNNDNFKEAEMKKWQERYDKEGWSDRKKVYKDFTATRDRLDKEQEKQKAVERAAGIEETDEKETVEGLTQAEAIKAAMELIENDQPAEAIDVLNQFVKEQRDKDPDKPVDPKVTFWMGVAIQHMEKFGAGKKMEKETDKKLDEEIKTITKSDETIRNRMEEENLRTLNIEGAKLSEERHGRKVDSRQRAEKESVQRAEGGSLEKDLIKDFYKNADDEHMLDKDGTGEEITKVKFDGVDMTDQNRQKLKSETKKKEGDIIQKRGLKVDLRDKAGKKISAQEAEAERKPEREQLVDDIAELARKRVAKKEGKESSGGSVFDLTSRIAAKRKANEELEKDRHSRERLRRAA